MNYSIDFNRYIFFDTLWVDSPTLAANVRTHYSKIFQTVKNKSINNQSDALKYIEEFLNVIKSMADRERAVELRFLNSKNNDLVKTYMDNNNRFNYLEFIKDLNLAKIGSTNLQSSIKTFKNEIENLNLAQQYLKTHEVEYEYKSKNSDNSKQKGDLNKANQLYKSHHENEYQALITAAARAQTIADPDHPSKISPTINRQFAVALQKQLQTLRYKTDLVDALTQVIKQQHPSRSKLQGALLSIAIQQMDFKDINNNSPERTKKQWIQRIKKDLNSTYDNILPKTDPTLKGLEDFIRQIAQENSTGVGLSQFQDALEAQMYRLSNKPGTPSNELKKLIQKLKDDLKNNNITNAKAKEQFSKKAFKLVKEAQQKLEQQKKNKEWNDNEINHQLQELFIVKPIDPSQIQQQLRQSFQIDTFKGSDMAELRNAVTTALSNQGNNIFLPGKSIQLKLDYTFTYHFNNIQPKDFKQNVRKDVKKLLDLADKQGKYFLQNYAQASQNRATNVQAAYDGYMKQVHKIGELRKKIIKKLSDDDIKKLDEMLDVLFGGVSVKEYQFYNNDIGYSEGALGGNGLVVNAVPNLLRMVELGGISMPDADIVIGALLNSFPNSIFGADNFIDIKNFLAAGAAMMLFDDGFTAGKQYLEDVKKELDIEHAPTALHLLLLNNIYIPQSYLLQNVYENLLDVYMDLNEKYYDIFNNTSRLTSSKVKNELVLENNLNYDILNQAYEQDSAMEEKWQYVSKYAQDHVKIHYFFMAGMLDILQGLEKLFTIS